MSNVTIIGIDLAKHVFRAHGARIMAASHSGGDCPGLSFCRS
jgi:predicted transcriptional regulator